MLVVQERSAVLERQYGQPLRSEDFLAAAEELELKIERGEVDDATLACALAAWLREQVGTDIHSH